MTLKYTRDFQVRLLINLYRDHKLFADTSAWFHLQDFQLTTCRLLFEIMRAHFRKFRQQIPFNILAIEVEQTLRAPSAKYETMVQPMEYEPLAQILSSLSVCALGIDESAYFRAELPGYLRHVRLSAVDAQGIDDADYRINETMRINEEVKKLNTSDVRFESAMAEIPEDENCSGRIGTGIHQIDRLINYGLTRKMLGLLVACTGVGKTCGMINFAVSAALKGLGSLFITMEMPSLRIRQRFQSMTTLLDAGLFNKPRSMWPQDALRRLRYGNSPEFMFKDNMQVHDASECATTVADIERYIMCWRGHMNSMGYADDYPAVVFLDWLERIDKGGIRGVTKNTNESAALKMLLEHVGEVARRQNVLIWTATQGTRDAQRREVLQIHHTANSVHVHDPVDLSIGLAPQTPTMEGSDMAYVGDDDSWGTGAQEDEPVCDRMLNASFLKSRYSSVAKKYTSFYQGSTLRFWRKKSDFTSAANMAADPDPKTMCRAMGVMV